MPETPSDEDDGGTGASEGSPACWKIQRSRTLVCEEVQRCGGALGGEMGLHQGPQAGRLRLRGPDAEAGQEPPILDVEDGQGPSPVG